jgi:GntR family transcriptional regulator
MNFNQKDLPKSKKPLYIIVYDKLFKLIMEGTFLPDSRLPTEPELAKKLGVSRMTLRQVLALFQDDGLVRNVHGKGNFITKSHQNHQTIGLEKVGNPLYKCHSEKFDEVDLNFRIDLVSDYAEEVLRSIWFRKWRNSFERCE